MTLARRHGQRFADLANPRFRGGSRGLGLGSRRAVQDEGIAPQGEVETDFRGCVQCLAQTFGEFQAAMFIELDVEVHGLSYHEALRMEPGIRGRGAAISPSELQHLAALLRHLQAGAKRRLRQGILHGEAGNGGMVVVIREVAQDEGMKFGREALHGKRSGEVVGEMAIAAHHALLDAPRIGADFQHLEVVIRFEQQKVDAGQMKADGIRDIAEVGEQAHALAFGLDEEAHGVNGIVGDGETVDLEIGDGEALAHFDEFDRGREIFPVKRVMGARVEVDRKRAAALGLLVFEEGDEAANMVTVLVADDHGGDFLGVDGAIGQTPVELAAADAGVKQDAGAAGGNQRCVARTAACQDGDAEDGDTPWNGDVPFSVVCTGRQSRREGAAIGEERRWFGVASGRFGDRIAV